MIGVVLKVRGRQKILRLKMNILDFATPYTIRGVSLKFN